MLSSLHSFTSPRRCFSRIEKKSFLSILIYICEVFFDNQRKKRQIRWNGNITSSQKVKRTKRKKHSTTSNVCEWREFCGPIIKRSKAKQTNLFQYFYFKIIDLKQSEHFSASWRCTSSGSIFYINDFTAHLLESTESSLVAMHSGISTYCDQLLTTKDKHRDRHLDKRYRLKGNKIRVEYHGRQSVKREKKEEV